MSEKSANNEQNQSDKVNSEPAEDRTAATRRRLLKGTLAGAGVASQLPMTWTRPATQGVLLPAHAETSGTISVETDWTSDTEDLGSLANLSFSSGDSDFNYTSDDCGYTLSMPSVNLGLSRAPGAPGTATMDVAITSGVSNFVDSNSSFDVTYDAGQTGITLISGYNSQLSGYIDADSAQTITLNVQVPGFPNARIRVNLDCTPP